MFSKTNHTGLFFLSLWKRRRGEVRERESREERRKNCGLLPVPFVFPFPPPASLSPSLPFNNRHRTTILRSASSSLFHSAFPHNSAEFFFTFAFFRSRGRDERNERRKKKKKLCKHRKISQPHKKPKTHILLLTLNDADERDALEAKNRKRARGKAREREREKGCAVRYGKSN